MALLCLNVSVNQCANQHEQYHEPNTKAASVNGIQPLLILVFTPVKFSAKGLLNKFAFKIFKYGDRIIKISKDVLSDWAVWWFKAMGFFLFFLLGFICPLLANHKII